ncbi:uncharacterized protein [Physcomitrium patens]|uniref:uncharacterized protein isoform X1 n=1 Tax=Physcomitrium patens TaxID=3218 RepID=UPI003CCD5744
MQGSRKVCTCTICTCGTRNCPRWPAWKQPDRLKMSVIPFCEGGKTGTTEYVNEYVPRPIHPPPPDHEKPFRFAHPEQTTYIHHYPWRCPSEHPYEYKSCPQKTLFKGLSIYTSSYTPPTNCPICPVPPFLSKKTTIDHAGHRIYD